jgi:hypothetical protein
MLCRMHLPDHVACQCKLLTVLTGASLPGGGHSLASRAGATALPAGRGHSLASRAGQPWGLGGWAAAQAAQAAEQAAVIGDGTQGTPQRPSPT